MSRRVGEDFEKLNLFLSNYSLRAYIKNDQKNLECKTMHKKLYGLLVFVAEFKSQRTPSIITEFLDELASDLLLSLFNWIQGMYKPSKIELRCATENFIKSLLSIENPHIIKEKSVYEIFDLAKTDKHFQNNFGKINLQQLRNDYSTLCRTVHSAQLELHSTSALNLLPQYNQVLSQEVATLFLRMVENSLGVLYINYPMIVDNMHPENKKDFMDCLSKTTKKRINKFLY